MLVYLGFSGTGWEPGGGASDLQISGRLRRVRRFLEVKQHAYVRVTPAKQGYMLTQEMIDAARKETPFTTSTSAIEPLPHWVPERPARVDFRGWAQIVEVQRRIVRVSNLDVELVNETKWQWVWSDFEKWRVAQ